MKKLIGIMLVSLFMSGCTGLELLLIGSMLGGGAVGYGKPILDKVVTPISTEKPKEETLKK